MEILTSSAQGHDIPRGSQVIKFATLCYNYGGKIDVFWVTAGVKSIGETDPDSQHIQNHIVGLGENAHC